MSEVAVIGGTGLIGRALVARLVESGHSVRIASRSAPSSSADPQRVYIRCEVGDQAGISRLIDGCTAVFHLATGGGNTWADFERDFIQGSRNVAEACIAAKVKRLIYTSSAAALYLGGGNAITDSTEVDPKSAERSFYSRAKVEAERVFREFHRSARLPVIVFRPGVVMGRGATLSHGGLGYWPADIRCLGWGRGNTPLPFVLVDDVCSALLLGLNAGPEFNGQSFNLAGDVFLSAADMVKMLRARSRRDYRFYPQSLWKFQCLEIGKWALKVAARKRDNPFPSYRDLKSRSLRAPFVCSAKEKLGWTPNSDLSVFIREAIDANIKPAPEGDLRTLEP